MPKLSWGRITVLIAAFGLSIALHAYDDDAVDDFSFMTLSGLGGIAVEVQGVRSDFERYGLESSAVKSSVETRLKENGIAVVGLDEAKRVPDAALMRIKLNTNEDQTQLQFYGVSLEIKRKIPINDAGGFISQRIWSSGKTGVMDPAELGRMNAYIADLLTLFLRDFHDQNPQAISATE